MASAVRNGTALPAGPASFDVKGGMVGGQLGYNWQFGQFVYGVEGDGDWTDLRGTGNLANCGMGCKTRNDFLSTARGPPSALRRTAGYLT